ncbi:hypothetical protein PVAG01_01513 [Phlyctema vagabunda]|uniref:C2H2-type domain-containing protein n=1 Tax=Phlyctema vagabunda TaxID=108571 RepID=A0ABR4PXK8_9HELO
MMSRPTLKRPSLPGRDSSGKRVDILNDDSHSVRAPAMMPAISTILPRHSIDSIHPSYISSPSTPNLTRADSYDSQNTGESNSPRTPSTPYESSSMDGRLSFSADAYPVYTQQPQYEDFHSMKSAPAQAFYPPSMPTQFFQDEQAYDEEASYVSDRGNPRRFPCKFAAVHNCTKTFTTSGHASRHARIHSAEKSVACTHPGCTKKFTRADNMKQHLDTHSKDKDRSRNASKSQSTRPSVLYAPAGVRKQSSASSTANHLHRSVSEERLDPALFSISTSPPPYTILRPGLSPTMSMTSTASESEQQVLAYRMPPRQPQRMKSGLDTLASLATAELQSPNVGR